ncbi:MAG: hypothetical protein BGO41_01460 [Clostridiales bacterium 38-18]|nr:MAG: hypothetical protein BGO41_01460 [Clostridiales bacterium 38-18]
MKVKSRIRLIIFITLYTLMFVIFSASAVYLRYFLVSITPSDSIFASNVFLANDFEVTTFSNIFLHLETYAALFKFDLVSVFFYCLFIAFIVFNLGYNSKLKLSQSYKDSSTGSHGTARWQTKIEMKKNYMSKDRVGYFIGGLVQRPFSFDDYDNYLFQPEDQKEVNQNSIVIAPSGKWKTTSFIFTNALHLINIYLNFFYRQQNPKANKRFEFEKYEGDVSEIIDISKMPDFIFSDGKKEIYQITSNAFRKAGYDIWVLDFLAFQRGERTNPLDYIIEEQDIARVAHNILITLRGIEGSNLNTNPIWINGASLFLEFAISYTLHFMPPERHNMDGVMEVFNKDELADPELSLVFHKVNNLSGITLSLYLSWIKIAGSLRDGILGGLAIDLKFFNYSVIREITSHSTIDFRNLGTVKKRPVVIYLWFDPNDKTFSPILNVTINNMFSAMYRTASKYSGSKLPVSVYIFLDEAKSLGTIQDMDAKLSNMRSFRIKLSQIFQNPSQIVDLYGEEKASSIRSNSDNYFILGVNSYEEAKEVSELLGTKTIKVESGQSKMDLDKTDLITSSDKGRSLMDAREVNDKPVEDLIFNQAGRKPIYIKKIQYEYWNPKHRIFDLASEELIPQFTNVSQALNRNTEKQHIEVEPLEIKIEATPELKNEINMDYENENEVDFDDSAKSEKINQEKTISWFETL